MNSKKIKQFISIIGIIFFSLIAFGSVDTDTDSNYSSSNNSQGNKSSSNTFFSKTYLNVRSGPGTNFKKIDTLTEHQKISVIKKQNKWFKVKYENKEGWVYSDYLTTQSEGVLIPQEQVYFIQAVEQYYDSYKKAPNELRKSSLRIKRKQKIEQTLPNLNIVKWIGQLKQMGTTSEGKAYITVQLKGSNIKVKNANNAFSDLLYNTLIDHDTNLYRKISNLSKGQLIKFSGTFIKGEQNYIEECSLTEYGSMTSPEFIMSFSDVSKY